MKRVFVIKKIFVKNYVGIALWPFIIVKYKALKEDKVLINHERIHLRQQVEMVVVFFFLWYVIEWFFKLILYRNTQKHIIIFLLRKKLLCIKII